MAINVIDRQDLFVFLPMFFLLLHHIIDSIEGSKFSSSAEGYSPQSNVCTCYRGLLDTNTIISLAHLVTFIDVDVRY